MIYFDIGGHSAGYICAAESREVAVSLVYQEGGRRWGMNVWIKGGNCFTRGLYRHFASKFISVERLLDSYSSRLLGPLKQVLFYLILPTSNEESTNK